MIIFSGCSNGHIQYSTYRLYARYAETYGPVNIIPAAESSLGGLSNGWNEVVVIQARCTACLQER